MFHLEEVIEKLSVLPRGFVDHVVVGFNWVPDRPELGPCLLWTRSFQKSRYGRYKYKHCEGAHQAAYVAANGDYDHSLVIDHLCYVERCVNPLHLRAVTQSENMKAARRPIKRPSSGCTGVTWNEQSKMWRARVSKSGKEFFLGLFDNVEEACAKVKEVRGY